MPELNFTNGFYELDSLPLSNQQCSNLYPHRVELPSLTVEQLFQTPGIRQLASTGDFTEANRGSWVKNGIGYFVNGETLYRLDQSIDTLGNLALTPVSLGAVSGTGRVSMADNGTQLMVLVPGGNGYIYNEDAGTPFQQITDPDFTANGAPQYVIYIDGYFLVTTDSKKWALSDLNDGLSWNALIFGTAESDPDNIVAPVKVSNQVFITGSITTEGFQNIGSAGFPFIRNNIFLDVGCSAPFSLTKAGQTYFMIGEGKDETPAIWEFAGNSYKKISTDAIDTALSKYTEAQIQNSYGLFYAQDGYFFVCFALPDTTFCFNLNLRKWHERNSVIDRQSTKWRVASLISAYNKIIVFDTEDGRIGEMSPSIYSEYGEDIIRVFSTQAFNSETGFNMPRIELVCETGVGNDIVENPQVSMAISKDGAKFDYERSRSLGRIGKTEQRIFWNRNGRARHLAVLRFRLSDQVKVRILGLRAA